MSQEMYRRIKNNSKHSLLNSKDLIISFNKEMAVTGISPKGYGKTYFAKKLIKKGQVVMYGFGKVIKHQTKTISVQMGKNKHYLPTEWTGRYWNHSCSPNTHIVNVEGTPFPILVADVNIHPGDEIVYSYWMTEYTWCKQANERKIDCLCGSKKCRGKILTFSDLSERTKKKLVSKDVVSAYLKHILLD